MIEARIIEEIGITVKDMSALDQNITPEWFRDLYAMEGLIGNSMVNELDDEELIKFLDGNGWDSWMPDPTEELYWKAYQRYQLANWDC
jgi:hypothetical protein